MSKSMDTANVLLVGILPEFYTYEDIYVHMQQNSLFSTVFLSFILLVFSFKILNIVYGFYRLISLEKLIKNTKKAVVYRTVPY